MPHAPQETRPSLPSQWYFDPAHYRRELENIWFRDWVCVGRTDALARTGDYFTVSIADQNLVVARDENGGIRAWHNVCRHRGSLLCTAANGRFRNGRIICPYHTWTYGLDGRLLATPGRIESDDFRASDLSLLPVHTATWNRFVFVSLAEQPDTGLPAFLGDEANVLANWPLADLRTVHAETFDVACNWKLFWENYSECYHCPRLHPELCRIMPTYRKAVINESDLPGWEPAADGDDGKGRISENAQSWTLDGRSELPRLPGLSDDDVRAGVAFMNVTGSMFIVAHPDYVRSVRILPAGPEQVRLHVDWMLPDSMGDVDAAVIESITGLARRVIEQDGAACELNQRGLHSRAFTRGVLVPQENFLWDFHEWLRDRLGEREAG